MNTYRPGVQVLENKENELRVCLISEKDDCGIVFYDRKTGQEKMRFPFPPKNRIGNVHYQNIKNIEIQNLSYLFYEEENLLADRYAMRFAPKDAFGQPKDISAYKAVIENHEYDWGNDLLPQIPYEDCVLYCMHVRGFTAHASSKVKSPGTFQAVVEKIPYLKELGITTLELQPVYEFNEYPMNASTQEHALIRHTLAPLNYWGYTEGFYYTPKRSYAGSENACLEFKNMVKSLHEDGLEVVLQFYFPQTVSRMEIPEILRFWREKYHVDGFRIKGVELPLKEIVTDAWLADCKLLLDEAYNEMYDRKQSQSCLAKWAVCQDDYMWNMRRFLRGDSGSLKEAMISMNRTAKKYGVINYLTNYYGFTLADMVSYEKKHNESNGEENRDGIEENYSCNYGVEGESNKEQIRFLRREQMKNAMTLLLFSQGTPMLFMGDEFANSQQGNNNPYCQDNEVTWLDWGDLERNRKWFDTVKSLIAFRKEQDFLRLASQWTFSDYKECGYPDLSYHGNEAWLQKWKQEDLHVGVMICGEYVEGCEGKFYYLAINMSNRMQHVALPDLPKGYEWKVIWDKQPVREEFRKKKGERTVYILEGRKIILLEGNSHR